MSAEKLKTPPRILSADSTLPVTLVLPLDLIRVSAHANGEPYFGASGANRFDAPGCISNDPEYKACYFGFNLNVAIAESLLHDAVPVDGTFPVAGTTLDTRYVHRFVGKALRVLDLSGALLKRMDGHADLSGTTDYPLAQQWALAVFRNRRRFDGFMYMSRHLNTDKAIVLFDRAARKLSATPHSLRLVDEDGFGDAAVLFRMVPA